MRTVPRFKPTDIGVGTHPSARDLDLGLHRADAAWRSAQNLKELGFEPDIIVGHHGWGEMLSLIDVWPKAAMTGYFEFYYNPLSGDVNFDPEFPSDPSDFPRVRVKNAINHIALNLGRHGHTPTEWQRSTYPDWAQEKIELIWEGVDLR